MALIYIEGYVDVDTFKTKCEEHGLNPQNVVFLFPGNSGHHGKNTTLFSIKSGGGLAKAAYDIGSAGYPTLSLPTTSMENWSNNQEQQNIVEGAIADLYRAIGASHSLMLPVREHKKQYFKTGLAANPAIEPSFWGANNPIPNLELAQHYIEHLNQLANFIALSEAERKEKFTTNTENSFYQAYLNGKNLEENDSWLKP